MIVTTTQGCASYRAHIDTVERRYDAGGAHLVAGGCRENPVPAILEYLPYRKRDGTYERDGLTIPISQFTATRAFASTFAGAANRLVYCSTSTPRRSKTMAWR